MTALTALALLARVAAEGYCIDGARVTGYSRLEHGTHTADGTSIYSDEPIAAASYDIPLQSRVCIDELGCFRVADRGSGLGSSGWIDVAVWSRADAFALTGYRTVCVYPPGGQ